MTLDGKAIAADILREVRTRVEELGRVPIVQAVVASPTPATESYLRVKQAKAKEAGMRLDLVRLPEEVTEGEAKRAAAGEGADAVIVQLPLPGALNEGIILDAVPVDKDADVLSAAAYERFLNGEEGALTPPVAAAIGEMLGRANVPVAGAHAVVIGSGRLVGQPARAWLISQGARVSVLTRETFAADHGALKEADIVVSGAGSPHLVKPDMLKAGAVLIDAGTSESRGAIVGDFDPSCTEVASVFTPVPGGVGPVAVACLFKNVLSLIGKASVAK